MKGPEIFEEKIFITEEDLAEMATLGPKSSGLEVATWIGPTFKFKKI